MDFPLLLAGPVLRRVDPSLVSVWLALSEPCHVRLQTWEGLLADVRPDPLLESLNTPTVRVGAKLHVVEVTAQFPDTVGKSFQADSLYSYDLQITRGSGTVETLTTLHLLEEGIFDGFPRLPLGFESGRLPSFAPPPSELANLNLLYGSCRQPGYPTPDALAMVDDLIRGDDLHPDRYTDPRARPHQLFLGGDQIYADCVAPLHMLVVMEAGVELIGWTGDPLLPDPVEHLPVNQALRLEDETKAVDPTPLDGYRDEPAADTDADPYIPAGRRHWPEGRRLDTTRIDAQLTSEDGASHVLSLGELAALYLSVWSPAVWGEVVTGATFAPDASAPTQNRPIRWDEELPPLVKRIPEGLPPVDEALPKDAIVMPPVVFPDRVAGHLYIVPPRKKPKPTAAWQKQKDVRDSFAVHAEFRKNLPKVQRALANVPTYMILDDHDVTDDYFLNPIWRTRVLGRRLGQAIIGNAMIAYALFQDWGNDPLAYLTGPKADLLGHIPRLFPAGQPKGPDPQTFEQIAHLLGHDIPLVQTPDGRFGSANPPLKWHFTIDGPKHRVIALDNRTRRSYGGQNGPPGNVSTDAMVDQIPLPPLPAGREILIVIAPLQAIGPPVLDELVAPLSYRIFDAKAAADDQSLLDVSSRSGLRQMLGTNPDAIEAWAFDAVTFEHLLKRLEPYGRAVLLSGDVHYASGTLMSYWRTANVPPARFAQFTSSGFKNVMPPMVTVFDRSAGFAQQMVRAKLGTERIGWDQPADDLVLFPAGQSIEDLRPVMKARLRSVPVMVPSWGWPDLNDPAHPGSDPARTTQLNPQRPPDWRWRVTPLLDQRADHERPEGIRLLPLEPEVDEKLGDPATVFEGYQKVAARHQHALNRLRNARQILFRGNVGRVHFTSDGDGRLTAIHEVYTTFTDPDQPVAEPEPEPFLVQVAPLGPVDEAPPRRLRQRAIEIPVDGP